MTVIATSASVWYALQYAKYQNGYTQALPAKGKVVFSGNPSDADTLTIDTVTYTFKTSPSAAGHILIGTTLDDTLSNLLAAIRGKASTGYYAGTKALAKVQGDVGTHTLFLTAVIPGTAGNSLTLSKSGTVMTLTPFAGARKGGLAVAATARVAFNTTPTADDTLTVASVTYTWKASAALSTEITIGVTRQASAANLAAKLATNANVANIDYTEGESIVTFTAASSGAAGNTLALTTTSSASAVTLSGSTYLGGKDANTFDRTALSWKRHAAATIDWDPMEMQSTFPLEIGQSITPRGAYKSGVALAGGFEIYPRFEDDFGPLLLAVFGDCSTTSSGGVGTHVFKYGANQSEQPWLAIRKAIPGRDTVDPVGVIGFDNKVGTMRLTLPAAAPMSAEFQFMGRVPEIDEHPDAWEGEAFEDYKSAAITCNASFKVPTIFPDQLPTTQVVIDFVNAITGPREEMIIGSYFLDDIVTRTRAVQMRFAFKWNSPELYKRVFSNTNKGGAWKAPPFVTNSSGGNYAVEVTMAAPYNIPGATVETPYSLTIRGNRAVWEPQGPPQLQAGGIVMQMYTCTLLEPASGNYVEAVLVNGNTTGYSVPNEP
jgi:hypothetical protein